MKKVLSIDIGILNLGWVLSEIDDNYNLVKIISCKRIDISICYDKKSCKCDHKNFNRLAGRIKHMIETNKEFDMADIILVEKQPPVGLIAIEELLLYIFPNLFLISPRGVHGYYDISDESYEERKKSVVKIACKKLNKFESFTSESRQHDIADAYCILRYWLAKTGVKLRIENDYNKWKIQHPHKFDSFAYIEN